MGPLVPPVAGGAEPKPAPIELKGASAGDFYGHCMARGSGNPPAGLSDSDRARARIIIEWFNAMATYDEKAVLRFSGDYLKKLRICAP